MVSVAHRRKMPNLRTLKNWRREYLGAMLPPVHRSWSTTASTKMEARAAINLAGKANQSRQAREGPTQSKTINHREHQSRKSHLGSAGAPPAHSIGAALSRIGNQMTRNEQLASRIRPQPSMATIKWSRVQSTKWTREIICRS